MVTNAASANSYNGDGVLAPSGAITYTQDLAAPLSQVLQTKVGATTTSALYGLERLASRSGTPRTWYLNDALGSVRRTLNDMGAPTGLVFYDPWGTPESGAVPTFGFTGELHDPAAGLVNLRARWYSTAQGRFGVRDPFHGDPQQPYSLNPYQYGYSDPVLRTDPSGFSPCLTCTPIWIRMMTEGIKFAQSVYDKQGISRDCTVTLDDGQNDLTDTVHDLYTDFICEYGSRSRFYPFNARLTQELYRTRAIIDYRATFYEQGHLEEEGAMGPFDFANARDDAGEACNWTVFAGVDIYICIHN
jgi:RHS repeat-associated protein